jgi:predicted GNAT family acetyltransferase
MEVNDVRVERCPDAGEFVDRAKEFLTDREAEHNLILGLCARLRHEPRLYGADPYFAVAERRGSVVAAALRTPPHNVVLSQVDDGDAVEPLAADAHSVFATAVPGVVGPTHATERFAHVWHSLTGAGAHRVMAQRIYRAEEVTPFPTVPGRMRLYGEDDRALVVGWLEAFTAESLHESPVEPAAALVDRRLSEPEGGLVLWEDSVTVSLAGFTGPTPNGIRVGPVYTPPEYRRRGYATALVGELTRSLLTHGRRFCFLFTDLANPTSNSIYQRVGYRPVTDVDQWAFEYSGRGR